MKFICLLAVCILPSVTALAQVVGKVTDERTRIGIPGATIETGKRVSVTRPDGTFRIDARLGDSITFRYLGFQSATVMASSANDSVMISLRPLSLLLKEVVLIHRDYRQDSLHRRLEYNKVFNYKRPGWKEVFVKNGVQTDRFPSAYKAPNSTASLVTLNVLSVLRVLGPDHSPEKRFQKVLLRDEENELIERLFSAERINAITQLKGDSLRAFLLDYRPSAKEARKMSEYDSINYIKKSYASFLKTYVPGQGNRPLLKGEAKSTM